MWAVNGSESCSFFLEMNDDALLTETMRASLAETNEGFVLITNWALLFHHIISRLYIYIECTMTRNR